MVQVCNGAVQDAEGKQTARKAGRCLRKGSVLQNRGDAFLQLTWYRALFSLGGSSGGRC